MVSRIALKLGSSRKGALPRRKKQVLLAIPHLKVRKKKAPSGFFSRCRDKRTHRAWKKGGLDPGSSVPDSLVAAAVDAATLEQLSARDEPPRDSAIGPRAHW